MTFLAQILNKDKRLIGSVSYDTWKEAAQKLRESSHPQRVWSRIEIVFDPPNKT